MVAEFSDILRARFVQPLADALRWWSGVQFYDAALFCYWASVVFFAVHLVGLALVGVATSSHPFDHVMDAVSVFLCLGIIQVVVRFCLPPARAFARAARRDPFLMRDARYHVEPTRSGLALLCLGTLATALSGVALLVRFALTLHFGHSRAYGWLAFWPLADAAVSSAACFSWSAALLVGGCVRSNRGVRRRGSRRERTPAELATPSRP